MRARPGLPVLAPRDYEIHVLITKYPDGGVTAQCLEFDLAVDGDTIPKAMNALSEVIRAYLRDCQKHKDPPMRPAPREYWNKWLMAWQRQQNVKLPHPVAFENPGGKIRFEVLAVAA